MVHCALTPAVKIDDATYPGAAMNKTNNLRRATGSSIAAIGEPIVIRGRVLDEKCLPVSNARVEIWHADYQGLLRHPPTGDNQNADKNFLGSGIAETNNLGEYSFLTILPGRENATSAPFANIRVSKAGFPSLSTRVYFADMMANDKDLVLNAIIQEQQPLLMAETIREEDSKNRAYLFNIVLRGKAPYKKY